MRVLNFADGFESNDEPLLGSVIANRFQKFESDEAFEAYKGAPAEESDAYFNTTTNKLRWFDGASWVNGLFQNDSGDVTIPGNLIVEGTTTTIESENLNVKDRNIDINVGGSDTSAQGAGLTVKKSTGFDGSVVYDSTKASKWKVGDKGAEKEVITDSDTQSLSNKTLVAPVISSPTGLTKADVGLANVDNTSDVNKPVSTAQATAISTVQGNLNSHTANTSNPHGVTKAQVGLGNVDNTSDTTKNSAVATLTNKELDGGTASNTSRWILPKAPKATLDGLTRKQAVIFYDTTTNKPYYDDGTNLKVIGSGSGGAVNLIGNPDAEAGTTGYQTYALSEAVTFQDTGDTVTLNNHGLQNGQTISFSVITSTTGIAINTLYYVLNATANTFQVTDSKNFSALSLTTNGSGTMLRSRPVNGSGGTSNVIWSTTNSNPLNGSNSFTFAKDANNRMGQGVSYDFSIPLEFRAKALTVNIPYIVESGTFLAGSGVTSTANNDSDVIVYFYDVTNSKLVESSSFKLLSNSNSVSSSVQAQVQFDSNCTSARLMFHIASPSASAYTLKFDDIAVSPTNYVYGTPGFAPVPYTPTLGAGFGTPSNVSFFYWRTGKFLNVTGSFNAGTVSNGALASISLPPVGALDPSVISINNTSSNPGSVWGEFKTAETSSGSVGSIVSAPSTSSSLLYFTKLSRIGSLMTPSSAVSTDITSTGLAITVSFKVPILGWTDSTQMSDSASTTVIASKATLSSYTSITAGNPINFSTINFDNNTAITTGSVWKFTAPTNGFYNISLSGIASSSTTGAPLFLYKNGSSVESIIDLPQTTTYTVSAATSIELKAGDYIDVRLLSTVTIKGSISISRNSGPSAISATETITASYYCSTSQSASPTSPINFDSKIEDSHGAVTVGSAWRFTSPATREYIITGMVNNSGTLSGAHMTIFKNGASNKSIGYHPSNGATSVSGKIRLNAGEYIDIRPHVSAGYAGNNYTVPGTTNISITSVGF